jgi:lipopolysaccharide/colanic/teichoic acid biosynthesis glycosyltransferase
VTGKRAFDVAAALMVLLLLAPLLIVVALAIKLSSPGPVFFKQERIGRGGRRFKMLKFRTMVANAERLGPNVSATQDRRITALGRVLRRCFLDEAPQLVNVLRGDMSLVGPRPETPEYASLLSPGQRRVLTVRPGMTGPSTIAYSAVEAEILAAQEDPDRYYRDHLLHARISADLEYIERASLGADLRILGRTALLVAAGLGVPLRPRQAPEEQVESVR